MYRSVFFVNSSVSIQIFFPSFSKCNDPNAITSASVSTVRIMMFEGDESLIWDEKNLNLNHLENFSLARMTNTKWMDKNINAKIISSKAYSKIQKIYLNKINNNNVYYFDIFLLSNKNKNFLKKWITFELIMLSTNCNHGLNGINRKFYWDSFYNAFLPIFYDGNCKID